MNIGRLILPACCAVAALVPAAAQEYPASAAAQEHSVPAAAQERRIEDPETVARRRADELNEVLQLSEKQYRKVYKLCLKEAKSRSTGDRSASHPSQGGGRPPQRGGMSGGAPGHGMGGAGGMGGMGGMGAMGGAGGRPGGGGDARMMPPGSKSETADEEAVAKKMRKILTEEQYAKWDGMRFDAMMRRMPEEDGRTDGRTGTRTDGSRTDGRMDGRYESFR